MAVPKQAQLTADEAEANAAVAEMLSDPRLIAEFGMSLQRETTTRHKYKRCIEDFAEYLAAWYVTPGLLRAQRSDVARFIEWLGGDLDAAPPIFPGRPSLGQQDPRKSLSASTRKGYLSALRAFYYFCLDEHHLQYDPTAGLRAPKVEHKRGMTLNAQELQRFLDAPGNERDRVQAYLLVFTAQRVGALRDLRWEDVNLDEREITFRGKGAKTNVLPIHNELLGALSRWKRVLWDEAEKNPLIASALYDDRTAFVLLTRCGLPVTVQTLGKQTKWRAARCGLRPHTARDVYHENKSEVHPHAFRRSWATLQRRHGVALEDIADVLAHVSVDTTRKHYAFPPSEAKRRAVKNFTLS